MTVIVTGKFAKNPDFKKFNKIFPNFSEDLSNNIVSTISKNFKSSSGSIDYNSNIRQINACRHFVNPNCRYPIENAFELHIKGIPKEFLENDILPHFDRFGSIYKFRLLMDFNNNNRGYGYLVYHSQKAAALAIDVMNHFIPKNAANLQVDKSYAKYNLLAINVPLVEIQMLQTEFHKIFPDVCKVTIKKASGPEAQNNTCSAVLEFPDHQSALRAKKCGSTGCLNMYGKTVKIIWGNTKVNRSMFREAMRFLNIYNVPKPMSIEKFCNFITELSDVSCHEIVGVFPKDDVWLLECTSKRAAQSIIDTFQGKAETLHYCAIDL